MKNLPLRSHLVTIKGVGGNPKAGVEFQAYLREGVDFDLRLYYDTLFKDVLRWRETIGKTTVAIEEISGMLGTGVEFFTARVFSLGVAWTRKFGGVPEHLELTLPCRIWVETDVSEVFKRLDSLYDIVLPELGKAVSVYSQYTVSVAVGGWFVIEEAIVTGVRHRWADTYVEGVPAWCDVDIDVSTVYAVDRNLLKGVGSKLEVRKLREESPVVEVR